METKEYLNGGHFGMRCIRQWDNRKGNLFFKKSRPRVCRRILLKFPINPLRPNSDLSQTSHCNIKGLSVSEVRRIVNMITQVRFY